MFSTIRTKPGLNIEAEELVARIEGSRGQLPNGDPDVTADEIQAAIERAEAKRAELEARRPETQMSARCSQYYLGLRSFSDARLRRSRRQTSAANAGLSGRAGRRRRKAMS